MVYVLMLTCLWSAVGALVFFVRADITLRQRRALAIGTALVFGFVGWVDLSSIYHTAHSGRTLIANQFDRTEHLP